MTGVTPKKVFQSGKDVLEHFIPNYRSKFEVVLSPMSSWNDSEETAKAVAKRIINRLSNKLFEESATESE